MVADSTSPNCPNSSSTAFAGRPFGIPPTQHVRAASSSEDARGMPSLGLLEREMSTVWRRYCIMSAEIRRSWT